MAPINVAIITLGEAPVSIVEKTPLSKRLLPFDGLRGVAAVLIIFYHINPQSRILCWAWTLVDLFFIISGFLIGSIIYRGLRDGNLLLKNFWIRRVLRVWPVYYMTLGTVLLLCLASSEFRGHGVALKDLLKSLFFIQFSGGYLHPGAYWYGVIDKYIPWFAHSWSIAAEEQFYVLMPLILMLVGIGTRRLFLLAAVAIVTAEVLLHNAVIPGLLGTRMQGLALGLLLAPLSQWLTVPSPTAPRARTYALWIFAASFVLGCVIMVPIFAKLIPSMSGGAPLDPDVVLGLARRSILGMVLIYFGFAGYLIAFPSSMAGRFFSSSIPVYLGSISYALYMFHVPVEGIFISLQGHSMAVASIYVQAGYWVVVVGLAHLSRVFVENHFNGMKDRFPVYDKTRNKPAAG